MAEIELAALSERLDDDEVSALAGLLDKNGIRFDVSVDKGSQTLGARLGEEAMTEFLDRLAAHDVAAEVYLPIEFETTLSVGEYRVGSTPVLAAALEELKDELDVADDDEEEESDDDDLDEDHLITSQLKHIWRVLTEATEESMDRGVPIHIRL